MLTVISLLLGVFVLASLNSSPLDRGAVYLKCTASEQRPLGRAPGWCFDSRVCAISQGKRCTVAHVLASGSFLEWAERTLV